MEKKNHDKLKEQSDSAGHWKTCETCEGHFEMEAHTYEGECGSKCTVCEYASPEGHSYGPMQFDETGHWQVCTACEKEGEHNPHNYELQCSDVCLDCGFVRPVEHTYQLQSDETGHWQACTVCGIQERVKDHIPGPEADEENAQICLKCDHELAPKLEHVHTYTYSSDSLVHWAKCQCGELVMENHSWSMEQGKCGVCGQIAPKAEEPMDWDKVWIISGSALVVCTMIIIIVLLCVKKKKVIEPVE